MASGGSAHIVESIGDSRLHSVDTVVCAPEAGCALLPAAAGSSWPRAAAPVQLCLHANALPGACAHGAHGRSVGVRPCCQTARPGAPASHAAPPATCQCAASGGGPAQTQTPWPACGVGARLLGGPRQVRCAINVTLSPPLSPRGSGYQCCHKHSLCCATGTWRPAPTCWG